MIYVAIFVLLILLRWSLAGQPKLRAQLYPLLLLGLFLFSAFRFEVGCDWSGYYHQFFRYGPLSLSESTAEREPVWVSLFVVQTWLGLPYPWINVVAAFIFFLGAHVLARRQPDPFAFLILLYPVLIINLAMSGIRQAAAIGIMMIAFAAFSDRRLIRYVVLTIIAAGFHSSAMVFLLLTPLVKGSYSRNRLALAGFLAVPGALVLLSGKAAETAAERYVNSGIDAAGAAFRVGLVFLTGLWFVTIQRRAWRHSWPGDFRIVSVSAPIMLAMIALVPVSSVIADRLAYYLIPAQAMMFARTPWLPIGSEKALKTALPYLVLLAMLGVWTVYSWHFRQCYIPYRSWLFGYPDHALYSY